MRVLSEIRFSTNIDLAEFGKVAAAWRHAKSNYLAKFVIAKNASARQLVTQIVLWASVQLKHKTSALQISDSNTSDNTQ